MSDTPIDSLSKLMEQALIHQIIPFWYGTPWSFSGHIAQPGEGSIACGYFVSTTLRDIGINVNRYRLAQQSPINEAKSLQIEGDVISISGTSTEQLIQDFKTNLQAGLYFIGFDSSHVGYLLVRDNELLLIHSNYLGGEGVGVEFIDESEVFASYFTFYIVPLSNNKALLKAWKSKAPIKVVTS